MLVFGAITDIHLQTQRQQIAEGIDAIVPHAKAAGVRLAIEPLHPMYAADRSAVSTMDQANNMILMLGSEQVGLAVDVYHVWWDHFLKAEIERATGTIFAFHVCDWRVPTRNLLTDRAMMGDGCIRINEIRGWVEKAGFKLAGEASFLRNPSDTRDWNDSPRVAAERRGTSDRFVLKFVKP